ncbi:MAG: hypothetical protein IPP48_16250 [Chitinophagaceae bacterium]|nr:hypothetical protein [Chitinophagaceae bacterium]
MGMDRNTVIGFILIGVLLIGMFAINSRSNQAFLKDKKRVDDSIAALKPKVNPATVLADSLKADSLQKQNALVQTGFQTTAATTEEFVTLENELVKITFTNKGAQPKDVELKKFKTFDGKPLIMQKVTLIK